MVKLIVMLKKKQGMSDADFRDYYETTHSQLVRFMPEAKRYMRRYLVPLHNPVPTPEAPPADIDVITEVWFDDRASLDAAMARVSQPEISAIFAEDEVNLFDRSMIRNFLIEEFETQLPLDSYEV